MAMDRFFRLARCWSNQELKRIAPLVRGSVVNVSGWKDEDKEGGHYRDYFTGASDYRITNFNGFRGVQGGSDEIELDLSLPLRDELLAMFAVVYNHTTLEHIYEVRTAFKNLCLMSSDLVILVVPFAQIQHETDSLLDFWRFTPTCLRYLFAENGMTVVYESANDDHNAATYVFMVGSKNPEAWTNIFPQHLKLSTIASSLGMRWVQRMRKFIRANL